MNQHELDTGFDYSGSPNDDVELINFLLSLISNLNNPDKVNDLTSKLNNLKALAINQLKKSV